METQNETPRPELVFDGFGINGPDEHRTRIATLVAPTLPSSHTYGHLFAASPELVKALARVESTSINLLCALQSTAHMDPNDRRIAIITGTVIKGTVIKDLAAMHREVGELVNKFRAK